MAVRVRQISLTQTYPSSSFAVFLMFFGFATSALLELLLKVFIRPDTM
jgi:hypothetical protein